MARLLRWAQGAFTRAPVARLQFPAGGFEVVPSGCILEAEGYGAFKAGHYCPINIGDVYSSYQVLGKLGYGSTSTVWLARNLRYGGYHALKIFARDHDGACQRELRTCKAIEEANRSHPGHRHVRRAVETFLIERDGGKEHECLVQAPLWDSWRDLMDRNASGRFSVELLKGGLQHILLALDYLHTEADNVLHAIIDDGIFESFVKEEMETPSPRKYVDGAPVYMSIRFGLPNDWGVIVLSDFGEVVDGDVKRNHYAQPSMYRSPEVILQVAWSYPADIWNVGAMIWDVFEGGHLFHGIDPSPEKGYYATRAHLAEIIALLGAPPLDLLQKGIRSKEFFSEDGKWIADCPIPEGKSLEKAEVVLSGRNKEMFLDFVRGMLTWRPEDRKTAKEFLGHPWLTTWEIPD
ncbi:CMGC/DYRK protein kinase [Nannizzia gypsea CBS 118893]|uniref:non-specific serine/threonine protein kinase n=1 Tax=Arthroderma gypseum (strain ATCC MYA-4604 / CBS 118893) TaxID=535722 RepID=E4UV01_ARTGP|nr:CMGC/DYRK protein kinase [Nannizzia gypsea CBS 118893]EFR01118.1 CMGC/DYRK protein kinase [Nannizzia gypsea CBS 118893]